jgi:hypothetical protein
MLTDGEHYSNIRSKHEPRAGGAMIVDYDFMLGRQRFRGVGWRGLAALGLLFTLRAVIVSIIVIIAKSLGASVLPLLQRLLGI